MIYRADVIVLAGFNGNHLSDFGPLNHCRDFVLISNLELTQLININIKRIHECEFIYESCLLFIMTVFDVAFVLARELKLLNVPIHSIVLLFIFDYSLWSRG